MGNKVTREVYEIRFYSPSEDRFGVLSIAAETEWAAVIAFSEIADLVHMGQRLIKFI